MPTSSKNGGTSSGPTTMMTSEAKKVSVMVVPTALESCSRCLAPKYWATMTFAPVEMPMNSTSSRFSIGPLAPTAAKALSPT